MAKSGDTITLEFQTSEKVREPDVSILGQNASVQPHPESIIKETGESTLIFWKASVNVKDVSQEGITAFNIRVTDLAGNISNPKTSTDDISSVKVDLTKPEKGEGESVKITSDNSLDPNLAKEGDTVTLTFTMSESIQKPDVTINNYPVDVYSNDKDGGVVWGAKYIIKKTEWVMTRINGKMIKVLTMGCFFISF